MDALLLETAFSGTIVFSCIYFGLGVRDIATDERGVIYRLGKLRRVAGPGKAYTLPFLDRCVVVDMRPFALELEVPVLTSRDGTRLSASITGTCVVLQPERVAEAVPDHYTAICAGLEAALREAAAELSASELLAASRKLGRTLKKVVNEQALANGVDVQEVEVSGLERWPETVGGSDLWDVIITSRGPTPIQLIKEVRTRTGLGLKEAKDLIDSPPGTAFHAIPLADADRHREALMAAGARIRYAQAGAVPTGTARVRLLDAGDRKIDVIKVLRERLELDLAVAKGFVDGAPCLLEPPLSVERAKALVAKLEAKGARAQLEG